MILDLQRTKLQKQLFDDHVQRKVVIPGVRQIWNIKSFLMENLTIIMDMMMRERSKDANYDQTASKN